MIILTGGLFLTKHQNQNQWVKCFNPHENIWVADDPFGEGMILDFQGGQSPEGKNYALVQHKGTYVRRISFFPGNRFPAFTATS